MIANEDLAYGTSMVELLRAKAVLGAGLDKLLILEKISDCLVDGVASAYKFAQATALLKIIVEIGEVLSVDQLTRVINACMKNSQLYRNDDMGELMTLLFRKTILISEAAKSAWIGLYCFIGNRQIENCGELVQLIERTLLVSRQEEMQ